MKKSRSTIFREQLRSAITAAGLTQSDAAKYLGISATTLESWLTDSEKWGRVPHPLMQRGAMYKLWMKTSKTQKKNLTPDIHLRGLNLQQLEVTMSNFQSLMRRADSMRRIESDYLREAWWTGYIKGLRRAHHGERFGTEAEHELWKSAADSSDPSRAALGRGYRAGLTLEAHDPS